MTMSDAARRDEIVQAAVTAVDRAVLAGARDPDEQDYVTLLIARALVDKACIPAGQRVLRREVMGE